VRKPKEERTHSMIVTVEQKQEQKGEKRSSHPRKKNTEMERGSGFAMFGGGVGADSGSARGNGRLGEML